MAMCLAQFVISDEEYASTWKTYAATAGKWLIMDNGLAEDGKPLRGRRLAEAIKLVRPQEVVLPDLLDPEQNVQLAISTLQHEPFMELINRWSIRLMYVPHGDTLGQWVSNLSAISSFPRLPDSIGVSKFHDKIHPQSAVYGRGPLGVIARGLFPDLPLHYLGLGLPPMELKYMMFGRSCDTAVAAMYAHHGLKLALGGTLYRADDVLYDHDAQFDIRAERRVMDNMRVLNSLAQQEAPSPWLNG